MEFPCLLPEPLQWTCGEQYRRCGTRINRGRNRHLSASTQTSIHAFPTYSTGDEDVSMAARSNVLRRALRRNTKASNLSTVIDRYCISQIQSPPGWNERVQVCQWSARLAQKRM